MDLEVLRKAKEEISRYAPMPRFEPWIAGVIGGSLALLTLGAYLGALSLHIPSGWAYLLVIASSAVVGYLDCRSSRKRHFAELLREYESLARRQLG